MNRFFWNYFSPWIFIRILYDSTSNLLRFVRVLEESCWDPEGCLCNREEIFWKLTSPMVPCIMLHSELGKNFQFGKKYFTEHSFVAFSVKTKSIFKITGSFLTVITGNWNLSNYIRQYKFKSNSTHTFLKNFDTLFEKNTTLWRKLHVNIKLDMHT